MALWANVAIGEVWEMPYLEYMRYLRDSLITNWMQSEEGREYLDNAWLLAQTEPDRAASRRVFGR